MTNVFFIFILEPLKGHNVTDLHMYQFQRNTQDAEHEQQVNT